MNTKYRFLGILFMTLIFSFASCTKEKTIVKEHLNPPAWIQEIWVKPNALNGEDGFRFTSDDMFTIMYDQNGNQTLNLSYMESIEDHEYTITEQTTGTAYQFSVHYSDTNSTESWQFALLANGDLQYTDNVLNVFVYSVRN